ncbi:MAG TPA: ECF transporter S component [Firmicutes bacterium]|nr:ECF transporter S component [Bacillota bacterium]
MIESVLTRKHARSGVKIAVKTLISAGIIALAVILPQLVHLAAGAQGGAAWLPMYLPVLLGGCLLGWKWGLGVGILSPLVSFAVTSIGGNAMPAASRLPYMIAELAVFAAVSGLFSRKIVENGWMAFPAVLLAQVAGRLFFLLTAAIFQSVSPLSAAAVWSQIRAGLLGMVLQAVVVPFLVMGLRLLLKEKN